MNNFKPIILEDYRSRCQLFMCTEDDTLYELKVRKNAIIAIAEDYVWVCNKVPDYKGKTGNARLELYIYDPALAKWDRGVFRNYITHEMWLAHYVAKTPISERLPKQIITERQASRMMQSAVRKHKHGNGGSRIINEEAIVTDYECVGLGNKKLITKPEKYWSHINVETY